MKTWMQTATAWWRRGPKPSRRWLVYFYYHLLLAVILAAAAAFDWRHCYPGQLAANLSGEGRLFAQLAIGLLLAQAALLPIVASTLSLRLIWLARKGSPAFVIVALADTVATIAQYMVLAALTS